MITRDLAKQLTMRFAALPGFPREDESLAALVDAFERAPRNERHALQVAEDLQVEAERCPIPSEVWRAARATDPAGFWQGGSLPPTGGITTREEYLADPAVIKLAKDVGLKPEDFWPLDDASSAPEPKPTPAIAAAPKARPLPFTPKAVDEYRSWQAAHEPKRGA